jgi:uncharacterized protein (DUF2249 family)
MALSPLILDVRPDLRQGHDPFAKIMQTVGQLAAEQELLLIAPFEPVPLYEVLAQRGFAHAAHQAAPSEWRVTFRPATASTPESESQQTFQLDTRGMEPPEPLLRILNVLETLGAGQRLIAHIDREPLLLYPELVERGWAYEGASQPDGSFIIRISRPN